VVTDVWVAYVCLSVFPLLTALLAALILRALQVHHSPVWMQALTGALASQVALLATVAYRLARLRLGPAILGWGAALRAGWGRAVRVGLAVGVTNVATNRMLATALHHLGADVGQQQRGFVQPLLHAPPPVVLTFVVLTVLVAPIAEETFFRGYLFRALATRYGAAWGYGVSAGLFAFFHDILALALPLALSGLLFAWAYRRTGNLLAPLTAHATSNALALAATLLIP